MKLSQLALRHDGSTVSLEQLQETTSQLLDILYRTRAHGHIFDEKLADYCFFPLSQVLKLCSKRFDRLAELATRSLRFLLDHGWRGIAKDLGQQLLFLLTIFADNEEKTSARPEELQEEALLALEALFDLLRKSPKASTWLTESSNVPALGHCLSVILDGIGSGASAQIQSAGLSALRALWRTVKDREALANFLPGTVSALTKCLTPASKAYRPRSILITALEVLELVITSLLNDVSTRGLKEQASDVGAGWFTKSWLNATAPRVKVALANVCKLRSHTHEDVRKQLLKLCLGLLDECNSSLVECVPLLVETAMTIDGFEEQANDFMNHSSLISLASFHPSISQAMSTTMYNWVTGLPTVMQSSDESAKHTALRRLSKLGRITPDLDISSDFLTSALVDALRDSITVAIEPSTSAKASVRPTSDALIAFANDASETKSFLPLILHHESQKQTRQYFEVLLSSVGSSDMKIKLARTVSDSINSAEGSNLLASVWLTFQLLRSAAHSQSDLDPYIESLDFSTDGWQGAISDLYAYSITMISDDTNEMVDWRLQAICLEIIAYNAQALKESFRPDLMDTLYPIVQFLGSPNEQLRKHAIITLNLISEACGYQNTSELITENVDYLVNAISLRLDSLDFSPQVSQVMVMMLRLAGPSLVPYLDDVVVSVFAVLDNYHGYTRLVESLFLVLGEIVDTSIESQQLRLTASEQVGHKKKSLPEVRIQDIVELLHKMVAKATELDEKEPHVDFPKEPWKGASSLLEEREAPGDEPQDEQAMEVEKAPPTKIYTMVQNIARLAQHYLTHQSPFLRRNILHLTQIASRALAKDEDQFLPLVNDLWPVLIKRLYDAEPFVAISACEAVSEMCRCAGDFLTTRIQVEWKDLMKNMRQMKGKAEVEKKARYGRGFYSQTAQLWEALTSLLVAILQHVRIDDDMFDEALEVVGDLIAVREDLRDAFSAINADAVWLKDVELGHVAGMATPKMGGYKFASFEDLQMGGAVKAA